MCKQPGTKRNCRHYTLASHRTLSSRAPSLSWLDTESPLTRVQFWLGCLGRHASRFFIASLYRQVAESTTHPYDRRGDCIFLLDYMPTGKAQCKPHRFRLVATTTVSLPSALSDVLVGCKQPTSCLFPLSCCRDLPARVRCDCAALPTQRWSEAVG